MQTYAVVNSKGGVGKTTIAVNLGHGLARRGHRVLLIDADQQGNCSVWLAVEQAQTTLFDVLMGDAGLDAAIVQARENLYIVPSGGDALGAMTYYLQEQRTPATVLQEALERVASNFDWCLIDCAPSRTLVHTLAVVASDGVLVPVNMEWLAVVGGAQAARAIGQVAERYQLDVAVKLVIPTFMDRRRRRACNEIMEMLDKQYEGKVAPAIRINSRISEAPGYGQTVYDRGDKRGIEDFERLVERVLEIG